MREQMSAGKKRIFRIKGPDRALSETHRPHKEPVPQIDRWANQRFSVIGIRIAEEDGRYFLWAVDGEHFRQQHARSDVFVPDQAGEDRL